MGYAFSSLKKPVADKYFDEFVKAMAPQQGMAYAVTGTTSGTGFMAAKALASRGARVFCLNRYVRMLTFIYFPSIAVCCAMVILSQGSGCAETMTCHCHTCTGPVAGL